MTVVMLNRWNPGQSEIRNYTTGTQPTDIVLFEVRYALKVSACMCRLCMLCVFVVCAGNGSSAATQLGHSRLTSCCLR